MEKRRGGPLKARVCVWWGVCVCVCVCVTESFVLCCGAPQLIFAGLSKIRPSIPGMDHGSLPHLQAVGAASNLEEACVESGGIALEPNFGFF